MTTYLATQVELPEEITSAFCSQGCLANHILSSGDTWWKNMVADDSYEFDETCASCGKLVPVAPQNA